MIRNIPINKELPFDRCKVMVSKVDTLEKAKIARAWLESNEKLTNSEYNDLMMELSYITRELYREI